MCVLPQTAGPFFSQHRRGLQKDPGHLGSHAQAGTEYAAKALLNAGLVCLAHRKIKALLL